LHKHRNKDHMGKRSRYLSPCLLSLLMQWFVIPKAARSSRASLTILKLQWF
jgi:hypothetical protein